MPVPSTFGFLASFVLFTILYAVAPLLVESSANKITLPSALIWLTCISLSKLAILISEVLEPFVLVAVITPSILTLTDLVKSLSFGPIPVQTPPSQL